MAERAWRLAGGAGAGAGATEAVTRAKLAPLPRPVAMAVMVEPCDYASTLDLATLLAKPTQRARVAPRKSGSLSQANAQGKGKGKGADKARAKRGRESEEAHGESGAPRPKDKALEYDSDAAAAWLFLERRHTTAGRDKQLQTTTVADLLAYKLDHPNHLTRPVLGRLIPTIVAHGGFKLTSDTKVKLYRAMASYKKDLRAAGVSDDGEMAAMFAAVAKCTTLVQLVGLKWPPSALAHARCANGLPARCLAGPKASVQKLTKACSLVQRRLECQASAAAAL